jgi:hypothetical protein
LADQRSADKIRFGGVRSGLAIADIKMRKTDQDEKENIVVFERVPD